MIVRELALQGVLLVEGSRFDDDRGDFRRLLPFSSLAQAGFDVASSYLASAHNTRAGTVRGLHFQAAPQGEMKALWCHAGSLFDVLVDVRPESSTFGRWTSVDLSAERPEVVVIPDGVAHGYQTTTPATGVTYLISGAYTPEFARTIHWKDETLGIPWPLPADATLSHADASAPGWSAIE